MHSIQAAVLLDSISPERTQNTLASDDTAALSDGSAAISTSLD